MGFCFSFPMEQFALDSAKLMDWTKGFDVKGVIGNDVVKLLSGGWWYAYGVKIIQVIKLYIYELDPQVGWDGGQRDEVLVLRSGGGGGEV